MALNREIWIRDIVEGFFPNNSFVVRSIDHSMYVNNKTVHIPNAGGEPEVKKNNSSYPVSATKRTDQDLTYSIDDYKVVPIHIQDSEVVELSYDKRQSIIAQSKNVLQRTAIEGVLNSWIPASPLKYETSGSSVAAHIPTATGNRKAMSTADVRALKKMMDKDDIPAEGRYVLLDAEMYNQLLDSMTDAEVVNFLAGANVENGVIGRYMGFEFYMRSKVLKSDNTGTKKEWGTSAAATDCAAGVAWHSGCVSRALGDIIMFDDQDNPLYYGDIVSFEVRAGGTCIRQDKKGLIFIYQGTAE